MSGALDAVRKLAAKASKRPWRVAGPMNSYILNAGSDHVAVTISQHEERQLPFVTNAALTTLAVNNIEAAVEALEKRVTPEGHLRLSHDHAECRAVAEVLAAIERDAKAAVEGG